MKSPTRSPVWPLLAVLSLPACAFCQDASFNLNFTQAVYSSAEGILGEAQIVRTTNVSQVPVSFTYPDGEPAGSFAGTLEIDASRTVNVQSTAGNRFLLGSVPQFAVHARLKGVWTRTQGPGLHRLSVFIVYRPDEFPCEGAANFREAADLNASQVDIDQLCSVIPSLDISNAAPRQGKILTTVQIAAGRGQAIGCCKTFRVNVELTYDPPPPPSDLFVTYIRAVQVAHDPAHTRTLLVKDKPTVVRVFVKSKNDPRTPVAGVSARLRAILPGATAATAALTPLGHNTVTAPYYDGPVPPPGEPDDNDPSLDFLLPAEWIAQAASLELEASIELPPDLSDPDPGNNTLRDSVTIVEPRLDPDAVEPGVLSIGYVAICTQPPGQETRCPSAELGGLEKSVERLFPLPRGTAEFFRAATIVNPLQLPPTNAAGLQSLKIALRNYAWRIPVVPGKQWDQLVGFLPDLAGIPAAGEADTLWGDGEGRVSLVPDASARGPAGAARTADALAHAIGHNFGLRHVNTNDPPACPATAADPCTPWPYDNPSIQTAGYDIAHSRPVPGRASYDLMSYCDSPLWLSEFHYRALYENGLRPSDAPPNPLVEACKPNSSAASPGFDLLSQAPGAVTRGGAERGGAEPGAVTRDAVTRDAVTRDAVTRDAVARDAVARDAVARDAVARDAAPPRLRRLTATPRDYLLISGSVTRDGSAASLDPAFHVSTRQQPAPPIASPDYCLRYFGAGGGLGDACFPVSFRATESDRLLDQAAFGLLASPPPGTTRIALLVDGVERASLAAGAQPPTLSISSPRAGDLWDDAAPHDLVWTASGPAPLRYIVDYSADGGGTWQPLSLPGDATSLRLDPAALDGGTNVFFRVQVSDGLGTAQQTVGPIAIAQTPRLSGPAAVDFGNALFLQPVQRDVRLTNPGTGPLQVTAITSTNPAFRTSRRVPFAIPAGDAVVVPVLYSTPTVSAETGLLRIAGNAAAGTLEIALQGNTVARSVADAVVSAAEIDFGAVPLGGSKTGAVTLTNFGPGLMQVTALTVKGSGFLFDGSAAPFDLGVNESRQLNVRFTPTAAEASQGSLAISTDDPEHAGIDIALRATGASPGPGAPLPAITSGGVVDAASFLGPLSPGAIAVIFGTDLAPAMAEAAHIPLPLSLAGVQVRLNSVPVPLFYVSPTQINFQVPFEAAPGYADLRVVRDAVESGTLVSIVASAPEVFTYARTAAARDPVIVHSDNTLVTPSHPASPGEVLTVYFTGAGPLTFTPRTGDVAPPAPLAATVPALEVTVGGAPAEVLFSGLTPGGVGLGQLNIRLAATLPPGPCQDLVIHNGGGASRPVQLATGDCIQAPPPTDQPVISVTPASLNFGEIRAIEVGALDLTIRNTGNATLTVTAITTTTASDVNLAVEHPALPFQIPGNGQQRIVVRVSPNVAGPFSGTLVIASDDPATPTLNVPLSGAGTAPPVVTCTYTLSATSMRFPEAGGGGFFDVDASDDSCSWTAVSNVPWITVTVGGIGTGDGRVTYNVERNFVALPRTGAITAAGRTYTVSQDAAAVSHILLQVDGGVFNGSIGYAGGQKGAVFANRLTPPSYPATLEDVRVFVASRENGLPFGTPIKILVSTTTNGGVSFGEFRTYNATVGEPGLFTTYPVDPLTIFNGDFVVGYQVDQPFAVLPADTDTSSPARNRSYTAPGNFNLLLIQDVIQGARGNLGIRAGVAIPQ